MCSFLITNVPNPDVGLANRFQKLRGPDATCSMMVEGITFVHNLLSINGRFTLQPFRTENTICVYNGEIYNSKHFGSYGSDGPCILPLYENYGASFASHLDGEFAIAILDLENRKLVLTTDVFGTKPIHIGLRGNEFAVASYASAITALGFSECIKIPPNTTIEYDIATLAPRATRSVHKFSLKQYKTTYDDWMSAFSNAINKRTELCRAGIFIGLSSGYDSGAISCELNRQDIAYKSYSVVGIEYEDIIRQRISKQSPSCRHDVIKASDELKAEARRYIEENIEHLTYVTYSASSDYNEFNLALTKDSGSTGLSIICAKAKRDNLRVYISGQGADEIISDYGFGGRKFYPHSNFGGLFPDKLEEIYPWPSFYGSSQASYLMKEEYIAGSYGIEARYPYLDTTLVQEFLHLSASLKNSNYKSALRMYLGQNGFPSKFDEKIGFVP